MSATSSTAASTAASSPAAAAGWIVSPAFDLLFFANVLWLAALLPWITADGQTTYLDFWQVYFLTTPHRWLTLVLVTLDPDRRGGRAWPFWTIALGAAGAMAAVWSFTGALTCLVLVDYIWNGWHFAAQHYGVARIYARKSGGGGRELERWGLRLAIVYVILRLAGWTTGWLEAAAAWRPLVAAGDAVALTALAVAVIGAWRSRSPAARGRQVYVTSVALLYGLLLAAVIFGQRRWVLGLTAASAAFHAIEYLALVAHYSARRAAHGSAGAFQQMARWGMPLIVVFALVFGLAGWLADSRFAPAWAAVNLWAAFVHYAFDGLIWKLRQPATAAALGADAIAAAPATGSLASAHVPEATVP